MRIELLGRVRAFGEDGQPIEISGARLRALLARLALTPGRAVRSDTLAADRPRTASELLGEALGLWRGTPLAGLEEHAFAAAAAARWAELRTSAAEDRTSSNPAAGPGWAGSTR
ncbi:BTAD domain-containing putative transcriptional regulator [Nonomuraea typhae]|uniref:BTAD domain-containing putative transcriptional regulator n=1 Tax=Nonomuraea typhae TaxID=2603600 RepID=A0ABW7YUK9_9ACTN